MSWRSRRDQFKMLTEAVSEPATRRAGRWVAAFTVAALLVAVVLGIASQPGASDAVLPAPPSVAVDYLLDLLFFLLLGVSLVMLAAMVDALWPRERRKKASWREPPPIPWWLRAMMLAAPLGLLTGLVVLLLATGRGHRLAQVQPIAPPLRLPGNGSPAGNASDGPVALAAALTVVAIAVVLAVALILAYRRGLGFGAVQRRLRGRALSDAVEQSLEALRAEPDPRRAVIAAYAALEGSLTRAGLKRGAHEAPFEYVVRVLARVSSRSAELYRLAELFEEAKFSQHDIDQTMKEEAVQALSRVRDDLRPEPAS